MIIRPIQIEDANALHQMRHMEGVFENITGLPTARLQESIDFINSMPSHLHQLVACVNNQVVGAVSLVLNTSMRRRHCATLGIMVHKDYQNQGIGTLLIKAILELADQWLMVRRIELDVVADNEKAIHLYQKMGFVIEGKRVQAFIKNGQYVDEYFMARINEQGC